MCTWMSDLSLGVPEGNDEGALLGVFRFGFAMGMVLRPSPLGRETTLILFLRVVRGKTTSSPIQTMYRVLMQTETKALPARIFRLPVKYLTKGKGRTCMWWVPQEWPRHLDEVVSDF